MAEQRPRVLFLGRGRYLLPLPAWLAKKWDAIGVEMEYRVVGGAERGSAPNTATFRLTAPTRPAALDGALFQARLPFRIRRHIREFEPDVIVCADPFICAAALVARRLSRSSVPVIAEVHGDWHTFTRSYGVGARRLLALPADAVAAAALRRADATRALSPFTSGLVEQVRGAPANASFPTYSDLSAFVEHPVAPLPEQPVALFVGVLEAYKNIDGLAQAWRGVAAELPGARLVIVGQGSRQHVVDALLHDLPGQVEHVPRLGPVDVAAALDRATLLVLPSWPEGLGRVVIEAFARGRGVVATAAGGILDLVDDGVEGILVPRGDEDALVVALVRVLSDRELAARLGAAAHAAYGEWHSTPEQFAHQLRELVDATVAGSRD
jgi:glycosyltransferase involved in cell wall biosynthesis